MTRTEFDLEDVIAKQATRIDELEAALHSLVDYVDGTRERLDEDIPATKRARELLRRKTKKS